MSHLNSTNHINSLTEKELQVLNFEYNQKKKSIGIAYLLYIFLGIFMVHRIYVGMTSYSIYILAYTFFLIIGMISSLFLIYVSQGFSDYMHYVDMSARGFLFLPPYIWLLLDLFRIPTIINKKNEHLKTTIIESIMGDR